MEEKEIAQKLDTLAEYQAEIDASRMAEDELLWTVEEEKQKQLDAVYTPEIRAKVAEIEEKFAAQINSIGAEFNGKVETAQGKMDELTAEIKAAVIEHGASVKGSHFHAVYAKGRISWDSKMLDGMIALVPQLATARKEGDPSVSLRRI